MSYVIAVPEMMTSAATDLATIGSDLRGPHSGGGPDDGGVALPGGSPGTGGTGGLLFGRNGINGLT